MAASRVALWASGHDESVEVNQRALIDKVLARYSGEFTVFRELLQNSDDAQSKTVEIHFETRDYLDNKSKIGDPEGEGEAQQVTPGANPLPNLKTTLVQQWTFKNNGILFRDEDWNRLKKIAEGNPDEEKIGAFGVGFYSLFSVTEEPFVTSGDQWMGFYWKDKKDQLFARRGTLPHQESPSNNTWTSFEMTLREPAPIPTPFDFTRFLASSITFMTHLSEINLYFNQHRLACLTKATGHPQELSMPRQIKNTSPKGIMTARRIYSTSLHIKAEVMRWVYKAGSERPRPITAKAKSTKESGSGFFSSLFSSFGGVSAPQKAPTPTPPSPQKSSQEIAMDLLTSNETSVALTVFAADIEVRLDQKIAAELYRSTKKNPPSKLKYELIYTAKGEYDASVKEEESQPHTTGSVFQGLRADVNGIGSARVFIGHATGQTTGLGGHMAARFIPTVERESIDLMDRNVAIWNKELLYAGGFLARCAYELELANINELWKGATSSGTTRPDEELVRWLQQQVLHALKFFTFHTSTPSSEVGTLMEEAFFACKGRAFPLLSTTGVRDVSEVRIPDPVFLAFLKHLPVLTDEMMDGADLMLTKLRSTDRLKTITFDDVLHQLQQNPLPENETIACLQWWINVVQKENSPHLLAFREKLVGALVMAIKGPNDVETIVSMQDINSFVNHKGISAVIPLGAPLPPGLLPSAISKSFTAQSLISAFGWIELGIHEWLHHICSRTVIGHEIQYDITESPQWAEQVFSVISRSWANIPAPSKASIVSNLKTIRCVPTTAGIKIPAEAYFASASIFPDLPVVFFPSAGTIKGPLEKILEAIGVRKHVDLQVIFDRMIKTNEWTVADLAKYLASVRNTLSDDEMTKLKATAAFQKLDDIPLSDGARPTRYRARQLYEPTDIHKQLGLPIIGWGAQVKWKTNSDEARFLYDLGLRRYPPLSILIDLCAGDDITIRQTALKYFLDNAATKYDDYRPEEYGDKAFVPIKSDTKSILGTPLQLKWAELGYSVVDPNLSQDAITKLRLQQHPPTSLIVIRFSGGMHPKDEQQAIRWFSILASRIPAFSNHELGRLGQLAIIPVKDGAQYRWLPPLQCYFGAGDKDRFRSKLFVFVDFGAVANNFLSACGSKREPSVDEVAQILMEDPIKFYKLSEGPINFLTELRNLAVNSRLISEASLLRMRTTPILIGARRVPRQESEKKEDIDEDDWVLQYDLKRASDLIIVDDTHAHRVFGDAIFTVPQEDILETFYQTLGSKRLSLLTREEYHTSSEIKEHKIAQDVRKLVLERLPLFLHEHTHTKTRVSFSWLSKEGNFLVKSFGKLGVKKSLAYDGKILTRSEDASAIGIRHHHGSFQLWLAGNSQVDMFEVANALNRLLFNAPKANDALLFMTILSTDLRALKRRGYNVDRIFRQQQAERKAAEDVERDKLQNIVLASEKNRKETGAPPPLLPTPGAGAKPSTSTGNSSTESPPAPGVQLGSRQIWQDIKSRWALEKPSNTPTDRRSPPPLIPGGWNPDPQTQPASQRPQNDTSITPKSDINSNIDLAVRSCRPEHQGRLQSKEEMRRIKESMDEGYCDVISAGGDFINVGTMGSFKVYVSREVTEREKIMTSKHDQLARFMHIIRMLGRVYKLPDTSLHVFYDISGPLIAFNRNGSLFMNLRYYEAWHDTVVASGDLDDALISWYFTLAHEIAHNLVQPHNSEHEFWFSQISQKHLAELMRILVKGGTGQ